MNEFRVGSFEIAVGKPPMIIAEMSGNHNQSLKRALEIVDVAARSGAHALKLQTYTADTMTIDLAEGEFVVGDPNSLWAGESLYSLYEKAHTPWEWHEPIFRRCRELGMLAFSTPFDVTAVDFLADLDVPCFKIASFENIDLPLIARAASTGKPLIISTGMATVAEIDEAVRTARSNGCRDLILLKCTSNYPAGPRSSNLATIPHMRTLFDCPVGLSDHTLGIGAAVAATALGAVAIEKHITLDRDDGGVDSAFSLEPHELRLLVEETARASAALGSVSYGATEEERPNLQFRRSLYVTHEMNAGDEFTATNVRAIRPGLGLPPKYIDQVIGRRASKTVPRGTPLDWTLLG